MKTIGSPLSPHLGIIGVNMIRRRRLKLSCDESAGREDASLNQDNTVGLCRNNIDALAVGGDIAFLQVEIGLQ